MQITYEINYPKPKEHVKDIYCDHSLPYVLHEKQLYLNI